MNASNSEDQPIQLVFTRECHQGNDTASGPLPVPMSTTLYMMTLLTLAAGNVVSNLLGAVVVLRCLSKSFISGLLLVLSAAEVAYNATQFVYQLLIWRYGYRRAAFSSLEQGYAVGYVFWTALLLSMTLLMLRNWVIVLISCVRFERVYFPFGPVRYTTPKRLAVLLTVLLALCLISSMPKTLRYSLVICSGRLTLSQAKTWLYESSAREVAFTMQSYFMSTLAPVVLVVLLNALILRAVNRQRRLFNRRQGPGGGGGGGSALSRSKVTDRLLLLLMAAFVLCELPAFVSVLLDRWLPAKASGHVIHVAHLATAVDSALNVLVYTMSQRQGPSKCIEACVTRHLPEKLRQRPLRRQQQQQQQQQQQHCGGSGGGGGCIGSDITGAAAATAAPTNGNGGYGGDAAARATAPEDADTQVQMKGPSLLGVQGRPKQQLTQVTCDVILESTF